MRMKKIMMRKVMRRKMKRIMIAEDALPAVVVNFPELVEEDLRVVVVQAIAVVEEVVVQEAEAVHQAVAGPPVQAEEDVDLPQCLVKK